MARRLAALSDFARALPPMLANSETVNGFFWTSCMQASIMSRTKSVKEQKAVKTVPLSTSPATDGLLMRQADEYERVRFPTYGNNYFEVHVRAGVLTVHYSALGSQTRLAVLPVTANKIEVQAHE